MEQEQGLEGCSYKMTDLEKLLGWINASMREKVLT